MEETMKKCLLSALVLLTFGYLKTANAEVVFLPQLDDPNLSDDLKPQVPFHEYENLRNNSGNNNEDDDIDESKCQTDPLCYATEEEASHAIPFSKIQPNGRVEYDSYYKNGSCYCLKFSCGLKSLGYLGHMTSVTPAYTITHHPGGNWTCQRCTDSHSAYYNNYKCSCGLNSKPGYYVDTQECVYEALECTGEATTTCVESESTCTICVDTGTYSGNQKCMTTATMEARCPTGYSRTQPTEGCWNEKTEICGGSEKCYQLYTKTCDGDHKYVAGSGTACTCACEDGFAMNENGACEYVYTFTHGDGTTSSHSIDIDAKGGEFVFPIISQRGNNESVEFYIKSFSNKNFPVTTELTSNKLIVTVPSYDGSIRRIQGIRLMQRNSDKILTVFIRQTGK